MSTTELNLQPSLSGAHLRTYEKIFRHPIALNLAWREIRDLLPNLGSAVEAPNGNLLIVRHGHTYTLQHSARNGLVTADELVKLRHFLVDSEEPAMEPTNGQGHYLLVINHHEARVYRSEMRGTLPERIVPLETEAGRHDHRPDTFARGREQPDPTAFFKPVAQALGSATQILVFGSGKGTSSEMLQFTTWLRQHHPELARKIIGTRVVDEHHLSESQVLALARYFYATR
jgi:hypothetical protein